MSVFGSFIAGISSFTTWHQTTGRHFGKLFDKFTLFKLWNTLDFFSWNTFDHQKLITDGTTILIPKIKIEFELVEVRRMNMNFFWNIIFISFWDHRLLWQIQINLCRNCFMIICKWLFVCRYIGKCSWFNTLSQRLFQSSFHNSSLQRMVDWENNCFFRI